MNPFELPGPMFLLFFAIFGGSLLTGLIWIRRAGEPDPAVPVQLNDPYEIACLRGGAPEVLRLVTTGLIDRGLLKVNGKQLKAAHPELGRLVRNPVERAVLDHFWTGREVTSMYGIASLKSRGKSFEQVLQERGLIAGRDNRLQMFLISLCVIGVLWATAMTKIQMAIQRGYPYSFLVLLAIFFAIAALFIGLTRKTRRGYRFQRDMQTLFAPLRQRSGTFAASANTNEALMMGAVFGIAALPTQTYPYVKTLFAQAGDGGGGSGSSCGSSSCGSSSCGSGCGGGGGCGGCGS